ncbi:MAG: ABC transporter substrate-binding protein [Alicyclobacillus sp.]|nr:ABC transporter substrate-binding protein [Alicyclobacillus sp.]
MLSVRRFVQSLGTLALAAVVWAGGSGAAVSGAAAGAAKTAAKTADPSYTNAVKNGVTLGIYPGAPYLFLGKDHKPTGIDWDINMEMLKRAGITKIRYSNMPWDSLIPALLSKRIDIIAGDIHETPERLKVIAFTGPAWWYGPAVIVPKGNPGHITSYQDLTKPGVTVGAINGSAAQEYLNSIHAKVVTYEDEVAEFTSLTQGRETCILEDSPKFAAFMQSNPKANLVALNLTPPKNLITTYGYSYARYAVRKEDKSLNQALTKALAKMRADGTMLKILKKWGLNKGNLYMPKVK